MQETAKSDHSVLFDILWSKFSDVAVFNYMK